jgi:putative transposase
MFMVRAEGTNIGRFKVRKLMGELKLISKQPSSHAYEKAMGERPDIPNVLNREFSVYVQKGFWCGDITYLWA